MNILPIIEAFTQASLDSSLFRNGLVRLGDATGCARVQLIGLNGPSVVFNVLSAASDSELALLDRLVNFFDPTLNFRTATGMKAAPLAVVTEAAYAREISGLTDDSYTAYCEEADMPFGCQTTLIRNDGDLVGLALLRTRAEGRSTEDQQAIFAAVAPYVRNAVRVQQILETQSEKLAMGRLETMHVAAFTCDASGRVHDFSPSAERLLRDGALLIAAGRLKARSRNDDDALGRAMTQAIAQPALGVASAVLTNGGEPLVLDVAALPDRCWNLDKKPRLLVVARGRTATRATSVTLLRSAYDLTEAEAQVALGYAEGKTRERIARDRNVSVHTIRVQTKTLFGKMAVNREVALAALAGKFL